MNHCHLVAGQLKKTLRNKNKNEVEIALQTATAPIGVADYDFDFPDKKIKQLILDELKKQKDLK